MYKVTIPDINNLGKHLDKSKDQTDPVNKTILILLDKIASLIDPGKAETDQEIVKLATQANNIRGKFLDITKKLNEAIPDIFLERGDYTTDEIPPSSASK
mgnify:CR=1 FL=1